MLFTAVKHTDRNKHRNRQKYSGACVNPTKAKLFQIAKIYNSHVNLPAVDKQGHFCRGGTQQASLTSSTFLA